MYNMKEITVKTPSGAAANTFAGVMTGADLSYTFIISDLDSLDFDVEIVYSDATVVGSIVATLTSGSNNLNFDYTHGTVTLTAATATRTVKNIQKHIAKAGDQASLPLFPIVKLTITTTNAADSIVIDGIRVSTRRRN